MRGQHSDRDFSPMSESSPTLEIHDVTFDLKAESTICEDCQQDRDRCVDCHIGSEYKSPDQPNINEER